MTVEEKNNVNNNQMMIVIGALLVVIAVMWFFLGKNSATPTVTNNSNGANIEVPVTWDYEELSIVVIDDKRCTNCPTDAILEQLQQLPSISSATIERKDFSDEGVEDYLNENEIKALPLIAFSTNNFDVSKDPVQMGQDGNPTPKVNSFLQPMKGGEFILEVGATYDPFVKRSENGFMMLEQSKLQAIKDNSYIKWNAEGKITWLEFSDLECPYCAKLHNSGTPEELFEKYGDDLWLIFNHFPLGFHDNAQPGAEILECLGEQKGSDTFYALIKKSYSDEKSDKDYLIAEAVTLWADEDELKKCLDDGTYTDKVKAQMAAWTEMFGVTGTPWNVLINNETWEYEVISGAYPTSAFEEIIDKLLK